MAKGRKQKGKWLVDSRSVLLFPEDCGYPNVKKIPQEESFPILSWP